MPTEISPYPMVPVDEALRVILRHAAPLPAERVARQQALGRVLAEPVRAAEDQPPFIASTVDGFAVRAEDGVAPRRLRGEVRAGTSAAPIGPGECVRIMTGAPLPAGADAVVMFEWAELRDGVVIPEVLPKPGDNLRPIGSDMRAGEEAIPAGARLGPVEIGLLAALGIRDVVVHRRPRVAILTTGDEIVDADATPTGPAIRDSNAPAALAALAEWGFEGEFLGIARDVAEEQEALIRRGIERADVVVTSGGVSVGTHDLIKPIFAKLGQLHFGRIAFKPGKPLTFATAGRTLLFGLPGNPVSAYVCLALFVRPALRRLAGEEEVLPALVEAVAGEPLRPAPDRPDYQRAVARWEGGRLVVRTTGPQGSSRLRSLVGANALVIVPAGTTPLPAGTLVDAILLGPVSGDRLLGAEA
ncbi:MAG: molybdopterin molybdotransferase MoeA [Chloroflexota bacterium]|nr:molybdopterin molybdotransferase MoeA [Dehalococcoidia bacterium]MDW8255261.1 molybdopterin molybdotransferase MoeA [Chloroflexota bacterium]